MKVCVVPKWASARQLGVKGGGIFSTSTFPGLETGCLSEPLHVFDFSPVLGYIVTADLHECAMKDHHWLVLLTSLLQTTGWVKRCLIVKPGTQPVSLRSRDWVGTDCTQLVGSTLGKPKAYVTRGTGQKPALPNLKWGCYSPCTRSIGRQAWEAAHGQSFCSMVWSPGSSCSRTPDPTQQNNSQDMGKTDDVYECSLQPLPHSTVCVFPQHKMSRSFFGAHRKTCPASVNLTCRF